MRLLIIVTVALFSGFAAYAFTGYWWMVPPVAFIAACLTYVASAEFQRAGEMLDHNRRLKLAMLWLRAWWNGTDMSSYSAQAELERITIREIREHFAWFGFDTSDMSDAVIKERLERLPRALAQVSLTAEQASKALRRLTAASE